jgi:thioredoxin-related protein
MEAEETTRDFIADLIAENCQYCKHMWEDIHTSPCICDNMADVILYHARLEREKEFITEWERQQEELQIIFGAKNCESVQD